MALDIQIQIVPYLMRPPVAHAYCGMSRALFDREIRPHISAVKLGSQAIAFERAELDEALRVYVSRNRAGLDEGTTRAKPAKRKARERRSSAPRLKSKNEKDAFEQALASAARRASH